MNTCVNGASSGVKIRNESFGLEPLDYGRGPPDPGDINQTRATSPQCVAVDNDIIFYDGQGMRRKEAMRAGQSVEISCVYGLVLKTMCSPSKVTVFLVFRVEQTRSSFMNCTSP